MWRGHCGSGWGLWAPQLFPESDLWHWKHIGEDLPEALGSPGAVEQLQELCAQVPPCRSPSWVWQRGHAALFSDLPGDTGVENILSGKPQIVTRQQLFTGYTHSQLGLATSQHALL